MKNKKGFTLVELLAVIIILGIILAIAVPRVINVITNSKTSSFIASVDLLAEGAKAVALEKSMLSQPYEVTMADNNCKTAAIAGVRYNTADYGACKYSVGADFSVTVIATGAATGKYGTQSSHTSNR